MSQTVIVDFEETANASSLLSILQELPPEVEKIVRFTNRCYDFYERDAIERDYHITNHDQEACKHYGLVLENLRNLTFDGMGAKFVFHGEMVPIAVINCQNVVFKNFSIDYQYPAMHQLEVVSYDQKSDCATCRVFGNTPYRIENHSLIFEHDGHSYMPDWTMIFDENGHLTSGVADRLMMSRQKTLPNWFDSPQYNGDIYPIFEYGTQGKIVIRNWNTGLFPGQRIVLRQFARPTPAIFQYLNRDVCFEQVVIHHANGMGWVAQRCENIVLSRCQVARSKNRYFTLQADATHFCGCRGNISVTDSLFENMADDAINVHGVYLQVIHIDKHKITGRYMHEQTYGYIWGDSGDRVRFLHRETMEYFPVELTIKKLTMLNDFDSEIEFEQDIPEIIQLGMGMENMTWMPEVYFARNLVRNNRARGALFSCAGYVLCEDNTFDHVHGAAILLSGDCNGWYESGACSSVVIRRNRFLHCLAAKYQFTEAVITIYPVVPKLEEQKISFHAEMMISDNIFWCEKHSLAIYAHSLHNLVIKNNIIIQNNQNSEWFYTGHNCDFSIQNNTIIEQQT